MYVLLSQERVFRTRNEVLHPSFPNPSQFIMDGIFPFRAFAMGTIFTHYSLRSENDSEGDNKAIYLFEMF